MGSREFSADKKKSEKALKEICGDLDCSFEILGDLYAKLNTTAQDEFEGGPVYSNNLRKYKLGEDGIVIVLKNNLSTRNSIKATNAIKEQIESTNLPIAKILLEASES